MTSNVLAIQDWEAWLAQPANPLRTDLAAPIAHGLLTPVEAARVGFLAGWDAGKAWGQE